jgi:hypothetical protein
VPGVVSIKDMGYFNHLPVIVGGIAWLSCFTNYFIYIDLTLILYDKQVGEVVNGH